MGDPQIMKLRERLEKLEAANHDEKNTSKSQDQKVADELKEKIRNSEVSGKAIFDSIMTTGLYVGRNNFRGRGIYHSTKADKVTWDFGRGRGEKTLRFVITLVFKRAPWDGDYLD